MVTATADDMVSVDSIAANYEVTPRRLYNILRRLIRAGRPAMVWGPPGLGKSDVSRLVAESLGMEYIDVRALLLDPVDLRGIPA